MQLELLKCLQDISNPFLDTLFYYITNLGDSMFYIIAITFIYWCVDSRVAIKLLFITLISYLTNSGLKQVFHTQRPFYTEGIYTTEKAEISGYSFPSGHTQGVTVFWLYLIKNVNKKTINIIGGIIITLVAFSRLYLRVHWPIDVLGGFVIGVILVFILDYFIDIIRQKGIQNIIISLFALACLALIIIMPLDMKIKKIIVLFIAAIVGYITKNYFINYSERTTIRNQILKCIIGFVVIILIKSGLKGILPSINFFDYVRYFILGLWVTLLAPMLFIKLNLSDE